MLSVSSHHAMQGRRRSCNDEHTKGRIDTTTPSTIPYRWETHRTLNTGRADSDTENEKLSKLAESIRHITLVKHDKLCP